MIRDVAAPYHYVWALWSLDGQCFSQTTPIILWWGNWQSRISTRTRNIVSVEFACFCHRYVLYACEHTSVTKDLTYCPPLPDKKKSVTQIYCMMFVWFIGTFQPGHHKIDFHSMLSHASTIIIQSWSGINSVRLPIQLIYFWFSADLWTSNSSIIVVTEIKTCPICRKWVLKTLEWMKKTVCECFINRSSPQLSFGCINSCCL